MNIHNPSAYPWNGQGLDPDVIRRNEEQLEGLLRVARARNAVSPDRMTVTLPKPETDSRWTWLTRAVLWLLMLMMIGVACLPFGAEVVGIALWPSTP